MTLTVPMGGVVAGRSASVRIEAPDTGGIIAEFGQRMADRATRIMDERNALTQQRVQLDIARDMGQARLEVDRIPDAAQMGQTWEQTSAAIRQKHLDQIEDPQLRERLELAYTEMNDRHGLAVGQNAIKLTASQRAALWVDQRTSITTEAASADPETFGILLEMGEGAIDTRLASGDLTPEQAALEKEGLRREVYASRAAQAISADPDAFLAEAEGGAYNALGGDRLTDFRLSAQREVARRADAEARAAEVAAETRSKDIGDRLGVITSMMAEGLTVTDEALLADPEVQAHPKFAAAMAAKSLRDEMPNIKAMTPAELRAAIAAEEAAPKTHKYQAERLTTLRAWEAEASKQWNTDATVAARRAGLPVPDLPAFDPAAPEGFARGISDRLAFDAYQRKKGYSSGQAVFSVEEAAQIKTVLAPDAPAAPKVALAQAILAGTGGKPEELTRIIGADPVFARGLRLLRDTKDAGLVARMLEGQQKEKLGTVSLPPKPQRQMILADVLGNVFAANPARGFKSEEKDKVSEEAEIMEAASALYAASAAGVNPDGNDSIVPFADDTDAQDMFRTAIQRVTGATTDRNGALTVGGLQEVNGARVLLPAGVPVASVESAWDVVDRHLQGFEYDAASGKYLHSASGNEYTSLEDGRYATVAQDDATYREGDVRRSIQMGEPLAANTAPLDDGGAFQAQPSPATKQSADPMRALKAASIDGSAPELGPDAVGRWRDAQLVRVEDSDVYELVINRNGNLFKVARAGDARGRAWRFRMPDLIRGAQR